MVVSMTCVECGNSVRMGSGRFVNRLAVDGGWKCVECCGSVFDCGRCGAPIPFDEDHTVLAITEVDLFAANMCHELKIHEQCRRDDDNQEEG